MTKMVWWEGKLVPGQHCEDAPCCGCCGPEAEVGYSGDDFDDFDDLRSDFDYAADSDPDDDFADGDE